ncbi:hypothetical protein EUTSA_v10026725mg [Eutrema salsugineum]|uniref:Uncharacterized protein n=1 Tax=Eutrema salsugineum TaxID=72664 RepID=V4M0B8_EUTSA|nr:hypothetical protein EUTSA_v10026725mg [Eutrema salsugineum]ESQ56410.1 hypothetical protein EUTSA_v10026725mg [Eutrema salsugineum]
MSGWKKVWRRGRQGLYLNTIQQILEAQRCQCKCFTSGLNPSSLNRGGKERMGGQIVEEFERSSSTLGKRADKV